MNGSLCREKAPAVPVFIKGSDLPPCHTEKGGHAQSVRRGFGGNTDRGGRKFPRLFDALRFARPFPGGIDAGADILFRGKTTAGTVPVCIGILILP